MRTVARMLTVAVIAGVGVPTSAAARADVDPVGVWPLHPRPEVAATFDPPTSTWGPGHRGVDLSGRFGQPVRAALPGRLAFVGTIAGRPVVAVDHGDTRTTYEPVAGSLPTGTRVAAGDVIGRLVLAGSHCLPAPCLHWGWLRGDDYLDPLLLVGGGPVRLLPLTGLPLAVTPDGPAAVPRTSPYSGWVPPVDDVRLWP